MNKKQLRKKFKELEEKSNDEDLRQSILINSEKLRFEQFSDEQLDFENEKRQLIGGNTISIADYNQILYTNAKKWGSKFKQEYFERIFILHGVSNDVAKDMAKKYRKPRYVAVFNNEIIYCRFDSTVLPILQERNPYVFYYIRRYKHYQFFPIELINKLVEYLDNATELMKTCTSLSEFRKKYFELYKVPYQTELELN
jgi:hypothetical protein